MNIKKVAFVKQIKATIKLNRDETGCIHVKRWITKIITIDIEEYANEMAKLFGISQILSKLQCPFLPVATG